MTTVFDMVGPMWADRLDVEVQALPASTEIGRRVVAACEAADRLLSVIDEPSEVDAVRRAVTRQADLWLFGCAEVHCPASDATGDGQH